MPWKETRAMDQKVQLIGDWLNDEYTVRELREYYNVSCKTIYKWIKRYQTGGVEALTEMSRAPRYHPNATPPEIVNQIIEAKLKHQHWGPKKLVVWLKRHNPDTTWPVASTAENILRKEGLVSKRRLKRRVPPFSEPFEECKTPNDSWSMDYKGQFKTMDGRFCYPLTISDNFSRYLLSCQGLLHPAYEATRSCLEQAFREYGLPLAIKSDNGTPFASKGPGGLSRLSAWLVRLWIKPERIQPGHPEQNGRHERMHRTLKDAVCKAPKSCLAAQQAAFDHFRPDYNSERPNEGIGMETPASLYKPSRRIFPEKLPPVEYESWFTVRQVRSNGCIKWKGGFIYISQALAGEPIGLRQIDEHLWILRFSFYPLGILDDRVGKVLPMSPV
jgi:transposase InsO family protein